MHESGLARSCQVLSEESGVQLNTLPDPSSLATAIRTGRWDTVLLLLSSLTIPTARLYDLYEVMVVDLVSGGELDAARTVLRRSAVLAALRADDTKGETRYLRLEALISQVSTVDANAAEGFFARETVNERREKVADRLDREVARIPNGRLLTLLGQALQLQLNQGILPANATLDIFHGIVPKGHSAISMDKGPSTKLFLSKSLPLSIEAIAFSNDGKAMAVGAADGCVEWLHPVTAQRLVDQVIKLSSPIMTLAWTMDNSLLVVGLLGGNVAVIQGPLTNQPTTDRPVKEFPHLHEKGITALCCSRDASTVLSAGYDAHLRLTSMRTGRPIQHFAIDSALYITDCCFSPDESMIYACSADGMLYCWDRRAAALRCSVRPFGDDKLFRQPLAKLLPLNSRETMVVAKNGSIAVVTLDKTALDKHLIHLAAEAESVPRVVASALSPNKTFLYILFDDKCMSVYNVATRASQPTVRLSISDETDEMIGLAVHPILGHVVTFETEGVLKVWQAPPA